MKPRTYLAQRGLLSRDLLMLQTDVVEEVEDSGGNIDYFHLPKSFGTLYGSSPANSIDIECQKSYIFLIAE